MLRRPWAPSPAEDRAPTSLASARGATSPSPNRRAFSPTSTTASADNFGDDDDSDSLDGFSAGEPYASPPTSPLTAGASSGVTNAGVFFRNRNSRPPAAPAAPARRPFSPPLRQYAPRAPEAQMPSILAAAPPSQPWPPSKAMGPPPVPVSKVQQPRPQSSVLLDMQDELLMSLLASQAVLDSQEFGVMSGEEVEELKKEYVVLDSRMRAQEHKLSTETKIRDAAAALHKLHASHKRMSRQASDQLESSNRKVEAAERELARLRERMMDCQKRLLEHNAGVLALHVRRLEGGSSGRAAGPPTPRSAQFDGPHLFAGNENAQFLASRRGSAPVAELEEKLAQLNVTLAEERKRATNAVRSAGEMKMEMDELEMRAAELEEELRSGGASNGEAEERLRRAEELLEAVEQERQRDVGRLEAQVRDAQEALETARTDRSVDLEAERKRLESDLARLTDVLQRNAGAVDAVLPSDPYQRVDAFSRHLSDHLSSLTTRALAAEREAASLREERKRADEMETMLVKLRAESAGELDGLREALRRVKEEREASEKRERQLEDRISEQADRIKALATRPPSIPPDPSDPSEYAATLRLLRDLWRILPPASGRAARRSPQLPGQKTPPTHKASSSSVDVQALRALYDSASPPDMERERFSVKRLGERVKALVEDDKALVARLIRFGETTDLYKSNAEKAQRLVMESRTSLETYKQQVAELEHRLEDSASAEADLIEQLNSLQEELDRALGRAQQLEARASVAAAHGAGHDAEVDGLRRQLREAQDELERAQGSHMEQNLGLLDELNSLQQETADLKARLRAKGG